MKILFGTGDAVQCQVRTTVRNLEEVANTYVAVVLLTDGVDVTGILEAVRATTGLPSAIATIVVGQCTIDESAPVMPAHLLAQMTGWTTGSRGKK
jgi:hypothetical protein